MKRNTIRLQRPTNKKSPFPASVSEGIAERIHNDKAFGRRNYLFYLSSLLQKSQIYLLWHRYLDVFRKFRFLSLLFRIYSYLFVLLQLGTAFFVLVVGLLLLLPLLILSAGIVAFSALLLYRRENKSMARILRDQSVVVFFPTRGGELTEGNFWRTHVEALASYQGKTVLIVSPYFWSGKGITGNRFYFLLRKEKENIYILRKHYYFSLKQAVLDKKTNSLTLIY